MRCSICRKSYFKLNLFIFGHSICSYCSRRLPIYPRIFAETLKKSMSLDGTLILTGHIIKKYKEGIIADEIERPYLRERSRMMDEIHDISYPKNNPIYDDSEMFFLHTENYKRWMDGENVLYI